LHRHSESKKFKHTNAIGARAGFGAECVLRMESALQQLVRATPQNYQDTVSLFALQYVDSETTIVLRVHTTTSLTIVGGARAEKFSIFSSGTFFDIFVWDEGRREPRKTRKIDPYPQ